MKQSIRIPQAFPQAPWRSQTQVLGLFLMFLVAIFVVAILFLNLTVKANTTGREIQEMQATIAALEVENSALQADLGYLTSVEVMQKRADDLGFELNVAEEMEFLVVDGYYQPDYTDLWQERPPLTRSGDVPLPDRYFESIFTWLFRELSENVTVIKELVP
jgi:cell division protein FtsL